MSPTAGQLVAEGLNTTVDGKSRRMSRRLRPRPSSSPVTAS